MESKNLRRFEKSLPVPAAFIDAIGRVRTTKPQLMSGI
jgi:hypothetical protein